jgi:hypothetical protein
MDTKIVLFFFVIPVGLGTLILVVGGVLLLIDARKNKNKSEVETDDWITSGGKILSARIEEHEARHSDTHGMHVDITYEPVLDYVYMVDNVEHHGNKVFPGESDNLGQKAAQEILEKYPVNSYAPVRYNPQDPSVSSLEEHPFHQSNRTRLAGQVLVAFGICVCCFTTFMLFLLIGRVI